MSDQLNQLKNAVREANKRLEDYLRATYPKGTRVGVRLKHGQTNWTWGIVHEHWGGTVQVHFPNARTPYRHIAPEDIMEVQS